MTEVELEALAKRCANHANKSNDNEWFDQAEQIANDAAYTAAFESHNSALESAAAACDAFADQAMQDMGDEMDDRFGVYAKKYRKCAVAIRALIIKD